MRKRGPAGRDHRVDEYEIRPCQRRRRGRKERLAIQQIRHDGRAERVMGGFLAQDDGAQPMESRAVAGESGVEAREQRLAQRFEDDLRRDDGFGKVAARDGREDARLERRVRAWLEDEGRGAEASGERIERERVHGLLPGLRAQEPGLVPAGRDGRRARGKQARHALAAGKVAQKQSKHCAPLRRKREGSEFAAWVGERRTIGERPTLPVLRFDFGIANHFTSRVSGYAAYHPNQNARWAGRRSRASPRGPVSLASETFHWPPARSRAVSTPFQLASARSRAS